MQFYSEGIICLGGLLDGFPSLYNSKQIMKKHKSLLPQFFQKKSQNCIMHYVCIIGNYSVATKPSRDIIWQLLETLYKHSFYPDFMNQITE